LAACFIPAALVWFFGVGRKNTRLLDVAIAATWGGLMREMLAGEPTVLVRKEVYITAALFASLVFISAEALGLPVTPAALIGGAAGAGLRLLAIWRAFEMPGPPWLPQDD
jgi:uncharacterized membrane protein YeiH